MRWILACLLLLGCDQNDWDGTYRTPTGEPTVLDESYDSETGALISYCRMPGDEIIEPTGLQLYELSLIWGRACALYPDRTGYMTEYGWRIWWVRDPSKLVPDAGEAVQWGKWPVYWDYPYTPTMGPDQGYNGMCFYQSSTDDHRYWIVVAEYCPNPRGTLAHEFAHIMDPSLEHEDIAFGLLVNELYPDEVVYPIEEE